MDRTYIHRNYDIYALINERAVANIAAISYHPESRAGSMIMTSNEYAGLLGTRDPVEPPMFDVVVLQRDRLFERFNNVTIMYEGSGGYGLEDYPPPAETTLTYYIPEDSVVDNPSNSLSTEWSRGY